MSDQEWMWGSDDGHGYHGEPIYPCRMPKQRRLRKDVWSRIVRWANAARAFDGEVSIPGEDYDYLFRRTRNARVGEFVDILNDGSQVEIGESCFMIYIPVEDDDLRYFEDEIYVTRQE